jgi:hypothetical protein
MVPILASSWWAPILQTAIGGAIGAGGAIAGGAFGSWFNWQHERQAIAAALAGEVEAAEAVAEFRQFRPIIESCLESTKAQGKLVYLRFSIDDHPFPVFEQNVSKIGFLPEDLAREVTEFYSYARSSVQDLQILYSRDIDDWPLKAAVGFLESMIKAIDASTRLAEALVPKLRQEATRSWKHYFGLS